jgi:hypothetical protein
MKEKAPSMTGLFLYVIASFDLTNSLLKNVSVMVNFIAPYLSLLAALEVAAIGFTDGYSL